MVVMILYNELFPDKYCDFYAKDAKLNIVSPHIKQISNRFPLLASLCSTKLHIIMQLLLLAEKGYENIRFVPW